MNPSILIFTDLDGSLLDHDGYSHAGAAPALGTVRARAVPLVFVTSKTRTEIERLQKELDIREPFVAENGGGIFFPAGYRGFRIPGAIERGNHALILLGKPYAEIRRFVEDRKARFSIRGAGDLGLEELVDLTGLSLEQARLAKQREFSEPFLLADGDQLTALLEEAVAEGLMITRGGRFHHLIGIGQDKGAAVKRVMEIFRANSAGKLLTVGIGDRPNDIPMLSVVDIPVLMPHPDGRYEDLILPNLLKAPHPGSLGWGEAVTGILEGLEAATG
jgi:mannosyl-3-phosphoglycerate phosphatase